MTQTIQMSQEEARALVSILQTVMIELGQARHALRATGHDTAVLCSDEFAVQLHQAVMVLEGNLLSAGLPPTLPEFVADKLN